MWKLRNNNLILNEKEKLREHKIYMEKLLQVTSKIEDIGPKTPYFMKKQLGMKEMAKCREIKRHHDNNVLFNKLNYFSKAKSPYNKNNIPVYCPAFDPSKYLFSKKEYKKKILQENINFYNRFKNQKSFYSTKEFRKKDNFEKYLKWKLKSTHYSNPNMFFNTFDSYKNSLIDSYDKRKRIFSSKINSFSSKDYSLNNRTTSAFNCSKELNAIRLTKTRSTNNISDKITMSITYNTPTKEEDNNNIIYKSLLGINNVNNNNNNNKNNNNNIFIQSVSNNENTSFYRAETPLNQTFSQNPQNNHINKNNKNSYNKPRDKFTRLLSVFDVNTKIKRSQSAIFKLRVNKASSYE